RGARTVISHAEKADKLLIKPAAGARRAPPRTRRQFIPRAHTKRPVTRRVTRGTATTRLATAQTDRPGASYRPLIVRGESVGGFADDFEVGLGLEDNPEPGAYEFLVVDDQDADHDVSPSGRRAWTA